MNNGTKNLTRCLIALAALMAVALSGCTGGTASVDTANAEKTVEMKDLAFSPASITIKAGTKVTWVNHDADITHTVTAEDGSFDSGDIASGASWSHVFSTPGTYSYYCVPHSAQGKDGHMTGMTGTIIVQ